MVLDKRGGIMRVSLSADQKYRIRTRLADIPPAAVDTVLRYEDRFFWHHPGINPFTVPRRSLVLLPGAAAWADLPSPCRWPGFRQGLKRASRAKLRQMLLALQLEWHNSKEEILEAYFELAPYGGNVGELGAAAVCYFHKTAAQLAPAESAALMLVPQNPARRRPARDNKAFSLAVHRLNETWFGKRNLRRCASAARRICPLWHPI